MLIGIRLATLIPNSSLLKNRNSKKDECEATNRIPPLATNFEYRISKAKYDFLISYKNIHKYESLKTTVNRVGW